MKIICNYCENMIDDSNAVCPYCGAPNLGVVRTSGDQPVTIEELKAWYKSKGLPPYETTRFFIGENYRRPRAFGIYQDGKNFIVYKNKDSGERAVRYKGTDEAYAVNELFQRLKQEIIQQKGAAQKRSQAKAQTRQSYSPLQKSKPKLGCLKGCLLSVVGFFAAMFLIALIVVLVEDMPARGYYIYQEDTYYYYVNPTTTTDSGWYCFDDKYDSWGQELIEDSIPQQLEKNKNAKNYFICEEWSSSLGVSDFTRTELYAARLLAYEDKQSSYKVDKGYYQHSGKTYYHLRDSYDSGWYVYDDSTNDWDDVEYSSVPEDLLHASLASDFFFTPTWDSSTQISDFSDTQAYKDEQSREAASSSSSISSSSSSSWDDDDDYDYSWSSSDSWDSGSSDWDSDW